MEDLKSDEMQQWMKAQAVYADDYLQKLPRRTEILKRLKELSSGRNAVGQVKRVDNRFYYFRRAAGASVGKIMMRDIAGGAETVLLDLEKLSATDAKNYAVKEMTVSPDSKYLAYAIFFGGSENGEIRVLEIATGKDLGIKIGNHAKPQSWLPDSKSFVKFSIGHNVAYPSRFPYFLELTKRILQQPQIISSGK